MTRLVAPSSECYLNTACHSVTLQDSTCADSIVITASYFHNGQ